MHGAAEVHAAVHACINDFLRQIVSRLVDMRCASNCAVELEFDASSPRELAKHLRDRATDAAVRCRILGMRRRRDKGSPGWIGLSPGVVICVRLVNRGDRPPEVVGVLRVEARDRGIRRGDGKQGHESGRLRGIEIQAGNECTEIPAPKLVGILSMELRDLALLLIASRTVD